MGTDRSPLGLLLLSFHSRFLGLNAEAKKRKKNVMYTNEEGISSISAILCVLYRCTLKYTISSFNDDDFTKTVFIIQKDKEYLFTGSRVCVCVCVCLSDT